MNFYIIDDDINIIRVLENIIEESELGDVIGSNINSRDALKEIVEMKPKIVLIDLLMPELDGINFIKKIDDENIDFIMISQVSEKRIIGKAYEAGVKFFINKPINKIEVVKVIENVIDNLKNIEKLNNIVSILGNKKTNDIENSFEKNLNYILNDIGIAGERGSDEIIRICLKIESENLRNFLVSEMYDLFDNSTAVKQRIRRALSKGLSNVASLGIEDYMNVKFTRYSSSLYDFQNVKFEMDRIRKKSQKGGKINVSNFINNLILMVERAE
jgi:two-component system response regulator YcbB